MNIPQPLVYFQSDSAFKTYQNDGYTARLNNLAVFVGETKKIYTHGEVFDCNNTVYDDTAVRGLITNVDNKIDNSVQTLTDLIDNVSDDLSNIHDWTESDIQESINNMMSEAEWIQNFISDNNIQTGEPFTITDVDNHLKTIGVLNNDGTLGWSTLQQNYNSISTTVNSLSTKVSDLENGGVDEVALQSRLENYIDGEIAGLNLDTTYAKLDDTAIDWLRSGFSAQTSPELTFSQMYSAATKDWGGDITTATTGVKTEIKNELNGYVATAELATKVENAGFAKTSGVVAKSDLDSSVAALFSSTSSTKTALDNKGYLTSSDLDGYATENYVTSAGFVTSSDLQSAQATMVATATNNATAAISAYVTDWWSGITIAANKVNLTGNDLEAIFAQEGTSRLLEIKSTQNNGRYIKIRDEAAPYKDGILYLDGSSVSLSDWDADGDHETDCTLTMESNGFKLTDDTTGDVDVTLWFLKASSGSSRESGLYTTSNSHIRNGAKLVFDDDDTYDNTGSEPVSIDYQGITTPAINLPNPTYKSLGVFADSSGINMRSISGDVKLDILMDPSAGYTYKNIIDGSGIEFKYNNTSTLKMDTSDGSITVKNSSPEEVRIEYNKIVVKNKYSNSSYTITSSGASQGSDRTLKDIVSDVNLTVEQVAEAPAVEFTWKNDQSENKQHNVGTIAQYWQVVLPEVVGETEDGKLTMQYSNAAMVSAIVTAKEVVALKEEIAELKRQIAELKNN